MSQIEEILNRQINSVKELKSAIKELQDSLVGVDSESEEFKTTSQQLAAAQDELNKVTRAGKDENIAAKDSIAGMEKEYRNLYNTYKILSEEQRNSDFGKNMASSLETLSTKLNDSKKEVGNFKDNIGRYSESVVDAFNKMGISLGGLKGPLQVASNGTKGLNTAFKALAANPLMLALTALVAIFMKVADAIKKNEELTDRLKQAMSVFQPVLNFISNAFDFLAEKLVKVVEGFAKVSEKVLSIIPGFKKATKETQALAKAQDDLNKKQREASVENSKKQAEVARLREEASATEDVMEKKRLLEEAKEKQREIDEENIRLAQEELDILQRQSQLTANSAADNDALAAAQKKVNDAVAQGSANMRQYNKELGKVENQVNKTTGGGGGKSKAQQEREEVEKLYQETVEYYKTEEEKLTEKYNRERRLMEKYHKDTTNLTRKYNEDMATLEKERNEKSRAAVENSYKLQEAAAGNAATKISVALDRAKGDMIEINTYAKALGDKIREIQTLESSPVNIKGGLFPEGTGYYPQEIKERIDKLRKQIDETLAEVSEEFGVSLNNIFDLGSFWKQKGYEVANGLDQFYNAIAADMNNRVQSNKTQFLTNINNAFLGNPEERDAIIADEFKRFSEVVRENVEGAMKTLGMDKEKIQDGIDTLFMLDAPDLVGKSADEIEKAINTWISGIENSTGMLSDNIDKMRDVVKNKLGDNEWAFQPILEKQQRLFDEDMKKTQEARQTAEEEAEKTKEALRNLSDLQMERTTEMFESLIDLTDKLGSAMSTYRSSQEQMIESQLKAGKIDEAEAKKKKQRLLDLQKVETAFNIATIVADAASGLFSIWKGYATEVGTINPQTAAATGPAAAGTLAGLNAKSLITAIAKSAGLAATATAQVAAARGGYISAKNNLAAESSGGGSGSGSGTGVASTPYLIDSQPFTYSRTLQTEEEEILNNRPIVVKVSDILDGIDTHNVQVTESTF